MCHQGCFCKGRFPPDERALSQRELTTGYLGITKKACEAKGCCWLPLVDLEDSIRGGPQLEQPACFHPNTATTAYQASDVNRTETHIEVSTGQLKLCLCMLHVHAVPLRPNLAYPTAFIACQHQAMDSCTSGVLKDSEATAHCGVICENTLNVAGRLTWI